MYTEIIVMENDYPRKKQFGYILSVALAVYYVICFLTNDFLELCHGTQFFYLIYCIILIFTIKSSLSDKSTSVKMSVRLLIIIGVSFALDFFMFLGFAVSLNSEGMDPTGIIASENFRMAVCNIIILLETKYEHEEIKIPLEKLFRNREDSTDERSSGDLNIFDIVLIIFIIIYLIITSL